MLQRSLCIVALLPLAGGVTQACSSEPLIGSAESNGTAQLSIASVPAEATCLRVVAAGSRTVTKLFDLTPGTTASLVFDRLPSGNVEFDAQAFSSACSAVSADSIAAFVAAAPVFAHIDPPAVAQVALSLIRNGRARVAVDFELAPWIAPTRAPVDVALIGDTPYGAA